MPLINSEGKARILKISTNGKVITRQSALKNLVIFFSGYPGTLVDGFGRGLSGWMVFSGSFGGGWLRAFEEGREVRTRVHGVADVPFRLRHPPCSPHASGWWAGRGFPWMLLERLPAIRADELLSHRPMVLPAFCMSLGPSTMMAMSRMKRSSDARCQEFPWGGLMPFEVPVESRLMVRQCAQHAVDEARRGIGAV
jgi:hypothetical protein